MTWLSVSPSSLLSQFQNEGQQYVSPHPGQQQDRLTGVLSGLTGKCNGGRGAPMFVLLLRLFRGARCRRAPSARLSPDCNGRRWLPYGFRRLNVHVFPEALRVRRTDAGVMWPLLPPSLPRTGPGGASPVPASARAAAGRGLRAAGPQLHSLISELVHTAQPTDSNEC